MSIKKKGGTFLANEESRRDVELKIKLSKIRAINKLAAEGNISEKERLLLHNEIEEGLGDEMLKTKEFER